VYHLQAGIAACHDTAPDDTSTDWPRILALYDHLVTIDDSPVAAMNRAVALARVKGPAAGLAALKNIRRRGTLESRHLFHAICGTLAAELGDHPQALVHFRQAGDLATLPAERDFIARQVRACENSA
jgi:RNA polymerase sigma-70 factor (ECF subfamily)